MREKEGSKSTRKAPRFVIRSMWKKNGIKKYSTHLFILLKRKNNHVPLKKPVKTIIDNCFLGFPCICSASSRYISRKKEHSVPLPSFIPLLGRKVYFMAMCCCKILKRLGRYLARNCFSSRKHLSIKISKCEEVKLISLFKSK